MGSAVVAGLVYGGCAPSGLEVQRRYAASLKPASLNEGQPWPGPVKTLKVRVHADQGHRKAILGWQVRFYRLVERINPVLRSAIGAELEIVALKPWDRAQEVGGLPIALFDLGRHDPGADVDLVIGLVSPFRQMTVSHDQLGLAHVLGRHLVVRPGDDLEQFDRLARTLNRLDRNEQEDLYQALRKHTAALALLHEIGHALGALHVAESATIMSARHSPRISGYGAANRQLMRTVLAAKGEQRGDPEARKAAIAEYGAVLQSLVDAGLEPEGRALMLGLLAEGPTRLARATQRDLQRVNPANGRIQTAAAGESDQALARRAQEMMDTSPEAAWALIGPIVARHQQNSTLQRVGCGIAVRRAPEADESLTVCKRAVELTPEDPLPLIWLAICRHQRKDSSQALTDARAAEKLVPNDKEPAQRWGALARLYQALSAVTWAEQAVKKANDAELTKSIEDWAGRVRKAYALPKDAEKRGVSPQEEPEYVKLKAKIASAIAERKLSRLTGLQAELKRRYPRMVQATGLCRVLVAKRQFQAAWPKCRAAARAAPRSADAQSLLAVAAFGLGRFDAAVPALQRAIRLAPSRQDTWSLLASAYRVTGQVQALKRLQRRYRKRFGRPMP